MIIVSLQKHFAARAPEWFASGTMALWGLYLFLHPNLFEDPRLSEVFKGLNTFDQSTWATAALTVGVVRGMALFVNGAYTRTPLIRLLTAFLSAFIWTQVLIGLFKSGVPNLGLYHVWFRHRGRYLLCVSCGNRHGSSRTAAEGEQGGGRPWQFKQHRRLI